jgi:hypothetical protein
MSRRFTFWPEYEHFQKAQKICLKATPENPQAEARATKSLRCGGNMRPRHYIPVCVPRTHNRPEPNLMQLTEQQAEFIELLEAASSRVNQFVEKALGPLVEAYGTACLAPSRLPLDYVLNLAQLYLRLERAPVRGLPRRAGGTRTARCGCPEKASRILTLAALQFSRHEGRRRGVAAGGSAPSWGWPGGRTPIRPS